MTSQKQAAANRRNALQSTGPTTDEGKAASRVNRLDHGLTGQSPVIPGESEEELVDFADKVMADLDPLGAIEEELARDVALCAWRLRRASRAEAGLYQQWLLVDRPSRLAREWASRPRITPELKKKFGYKDPPRTAENVRKAVEAAQERKHATLGEAISIDSSGPNALLKLARYETALSRRRDRSLAALLALQRERHRELPRELED